LKRDLSSPIGSIFLCWLTVQGDGRHTLQIAAADVGSTGRSASSSMDDKFLQIFALAYMIGWLLARLPKRN